MTGCKYKCRCESEPWRSEGRVVGVHMTYAALLLDVDPAASQQDTVHTDSWIPLNYHVIVSDDLGKRWYYVGAASYSLARRRPSTNVWSSSVDLWRF